LDEVRAARRRLLRENHPDHMIALGAPIEMVKLANQRVVDLNRAQDEIVRHIAPQHEKADIFTPSRGGSHT
jgi:DnaJ like chaperone protein